MFFKIRYNSREESKGNVDLFRQLKTVPTFPWGELIKNVFLESFFYACPLFVAFWIEATISSILDFISSTFPSGMLVLICSTILL